MGTYRVYIGGVEVNVSQDDWRIYDIKTLSGEIYKKVCDRPAFAIFSGEGSAEVIIEADREFQTVAVRPLSAGISAAVEGRTVRFTLDHPRNVSVEFDGDLLEPLFLFYNPACKRPEGFYTHVFEAGQVYDAGVVELHSGDRVCVEEGALVYGCFFAREAEDIVLEGGGVVCGTKMHRGVSVLDRRQLIRLEKCRNVRISGITLFDGPSWHCVPVNCEDVVIDNLHIISMVPSGDGVDFCGCRNCAVKNSFFRTNDDCVVIKALHNNYEGGELLPMYNIMTEGCVIWSATHGNGLEIGYELCTWDVYDIVFRDCDIIHCEFEGYQSGGALTIHNGDRADVHDILYEDIRIEDALEKVFDLKICNAVWSKDNIRGQIRNVHFKGIHIVDGPFPPSIMKGFETTDSIFKVCHDENMVLYVTRDLHKTGALRDILIEDFTVYGEKKTNFMDAKVLIEIATNITFK